MDSAKQVASATALLSWGASTSVLGVALCLLESRQLGGSLVVLGVLCCTMGAHRYGRAGRG